MMFLFCSRGVKWARALATVFIAGRNHGSRAVQNQLLFQTRHRSEGKVTPGCRSFVGPLKLGDDIRRNLILDKGDAVAQLQFAFFQTLQPQEVRRRRLMQGIYRRVEIAVLLLQPCKLGFEFALILVGHDVC
jgi:hypothetical protein